jgi:hypothetical protein
VGVSRGLNRSSIAHEKSDLRLARCCMKEAFRFPSTIRVAGPCAPLGVSHQHPHERQQKKSDLAEYRLLPRAKTLGPSHAGHAVRADTIGC